MARVVLFFCLAVLAAPAFAQPFSKSLAECGAVVSASAEWTADQTVYDMFAFMEVRFLGEAMIQAEKEGVTTPRAVITAQFQAKKAEWLDRGRWVVFSQDYKDWLDYCRAFADDRGITLDMG